MAVSPRFAALLRDPGGTIVGSFPHRHRPAAATQARDRFRLALFTYLQEREVIGNAARCPDTAQHIIRLLEDWNA